jgi:hypothetical protein
MPSVFIGLHHDAERVCGRHRVSVRPASSEERQELIGCKAGLPDDRTERAAWHFPLVKGDRDVEVRLVGVFERVVASLHSLNNETGTLKRTDDRLRPHRR